MSRTWGDAFQTSWIIDSGNMIDGSSKGLTSLKGAPSHVPVGFSCSNNKLTSLDGVPSFIGKIFYCRNNKLTSLKNIHLQIKHMRIAFFMGNPIESSVLGLLLIDKLEKVMLDNIDVQEIINKHLPSNGMESVLLAQEELILAGLEEYAQL